MHYYTATPYYCHELEMGETSLHGPFETSEERAADIETKRQNDHWNLQEDSLTILFLDSTSPIAKGETLSPVDPACEMD